MSCCMVRPHNTETVVGSAGMTVDVCETWLVRTQPNHVFQVLILNSGADVLPVTFAPVEQWSQADWSWTSTRSPRTPPGTSLVCFTCARKRHDPSSAAGVSKAATERAHEMWSWWNLLRACSLTLLTLSACGSRWRRVRATFHHVWLSFNQVASNSAPMRVRFRAVPAAGQREKLLALRAGSLSQAKLRSAPFPREKITPHTWNLCFLPQSSNCRRSALPSFRNISHNLEEDTFNSSSITQLQPHLSSGAWCCVMLIWRMKRSASDFAFFFVLSLPIQRLLALLWGSFDFSRTIPVQLLHRSPHMVPYRSIVIITSKRFWDAWLGYMHSGKQTL